MKLSASYLVDAPPAQVFAAITDTAVLARCIDGCEKMVLVGDDTYDAHLRIGVAGLKGSYVGRIQLKDKKPPASYALIVEGKGGPGFVKGAAQIQLVEQEGRTELRCQADVQVGGLIAAIGSRLIEATARKMMDEFFRKFAAELREAK